MPTNNIENRFDMKPPAEVKTSGRYAFWLTTEDLPLHGNQVQLGRDGRIHLGDSAHDGESI